MKVKIEIVEEAEQEELVIRCRAVDEKVRRIQEFAAQQDGMGA